MLFGIIGWIVLGTAVAFIASKVVDLRGDDPRLGIALGAAAGLIGGWLYSLFSGSPVTTFNIWSLLCAAFAAAIAVTIWHIIRRRRPYKQPTVRRSY
jgi:uncharacterized membrane protein YeaQ/YmgE (transglycosylase-associated protein family)